MVALGSAICNAVEAALSLIDGQSRTSRNTQTLPTSNPVGASPEAVWEAVWEAVCEVAYGAGAETTSPLSTGTVLTTPAVRNPRASRQLERMEMINCRKTRAQYTITIDTAVLFATPSPIYFGLRQCKQRHGFAVCGPRPYLPHFAQTFFCLFYGCLLFFCFLFLFHIFCLLFCLMTGNYELECCQWFYGFSFVNAFRK